MFDGTSLMDPLTRPWIIENIPPPSLWTHPLTHTRKAITMKATSPRSPFTDWIHPLALFRNKLLAELEGAVSAARTSRRTVRAYTYIQRSNGSTNVMLESPCTRPAFERLHKCHVGRSVHTSYFERLYKRHVGRSVHTSCVRTALRTKIHKMGCWLDPTSSECDQWSLVQEMMTLGLTKP